MLTYVRIIHAIFFKNKNSATRAALLYTSAHLLYISLSKRQLESPLCFTYVCCDTLVRLGHEMAIWLYWPPGTGVVETPRKPRARI